VSQLNKPICKKHDCFRSFSKKKEKKRKGKHRDVFEVNIFTVCSATKALFIALMSLKGNL